MAKLTQFLRNLQQTMTSFINFMIGREEDTEDGSAYPTQRNQYYT